ncbi:MAG: HAMP domain-containing histidine kinase [Treponema sp.]|jgi:signal transduction histidine kinase|nr:HAMP domain-containing histidine kinase [Treponema sp.]
MIIALLIVVLCLAAIVFFIAYCYVRKQQKLIDEAIIQTRRFISGDRNARIDSEYEGSLYKLFHEINTLATTLNAHAAREEKSKDFLRNTISDISHQIKTPLTALNIYNALLQEECEDKEAVCEFAVKSEKEIERIETLVQNLLKITKLDAGYNIMEKHMVNISEMMHDTRSRFEMRTLHEQKEIILSGADDLMLCCDRSWLMEALSNIVKNALDHLEAGGKITMSWTALPASMQIVIADNGSGIHPEDLHHIFKRFYRSRFSKDRQGIGLGLSLAKSIVEAHDGNITVDSVLGGGSIFTINFANLTKV